MSVYAMSERRRDAKTIADVQVEAFISVIKERYDLTDEELKGLAADLRWIRTYRRVFNWSMAIFGGTIIAAIGAGMAASLFEGIRHAFK